MRFVRALEIAFYPRWAMAIVIGVSLLMVLYDATIVQNKALPEVITFLFSYLCFLLLMKLVMSALAGHMFPFLAGPYREKMPRITMLLLAAVFFVLVINLTEPMVMEDGILAGAEAR